MFKPSTLSELLLFSTIRIEASGPAGDGVGTGFFFSFRFDAERSVLVVITNKHVVKGATTGRFYLHQASAPDNNDPTGKFFPVVIDNFADQWIDHPNPDVDLCAYLVFPVLRQVQQQGTPALITHFIEDQIWTDIKLQELRAVEDVLMIGYPTGLWDFVNNLPLIRRGITSSHPAIDFCGQSRGVIDMACFPGSSGSPVLIFNEGSYTEKPKQAGMHTTVYGSRAILLGVLFAGPRVMAKGDIIIEPIPTSAGSVTAQTNVMIHLGYYVKAKEILELGKLIAQMVCKPIVAGVE